jgi:protein-tyrosine-phosphatase
MSPMSSVLFLCTGNATRSVIAGETLRGLRPDLRVETAGTLAVDGLPISWRTRAAFDAVGLSWPPHRSRQATGCDLEAACLVIAMAPEHVEWVRREHPQAGARTTTLRHAVATLPPVSEPLAHRVAALDLKARLVESSEEIVDPGGGDVDVFIACAREVVALVHQLAPRL